jgi:hypothetical protein
MKRVETLKALPLHETTGAQNTVAEMKQLYFKIFLHKE